MLPSIFQLIDQFSKKSAQRITRFINGKNNFVCSCRFPSGEYSAPYHGISLASDVQEHFGK